VRPPVFPDAPPTGPPPEIERALEQWTGNTADDTERRCRTLRSTAIRHAAAGDIDVDALLEQLHASGLAG
jgi:hypothetical protein